MRFYVIGWALVAAFAAPAFAQPPAKGAGSDLVPSTAFAFVSVRVADLRDLEALKPARDAWARFEKAEGGLNRQFGMGLDDVDRVTLFWPTMPLTESGVPPLLFVTTREPFNEAKVLKALQAVPVFEAPGRPGGRYGAEKSRGWTRPAAAAGPSGAGAPTAIPNDPFPLKEADRAVPPPATEPPPKPKGPGGFDARAGDEPPAAKSPVPARTGDDKDNAASTGPELYFLDRRPYEAVYLLDARTLLFLPSATGDGGIRLWQLVGQLLGRKADGPLREALTEASKHTLVAALQVSELETLFRADPPPELVPFRSLLRARTAMITVDMAARATVTARLTFADAAAARRAEPVLKTLLQVGVDELEELKKAEGTNPRQGAVLRPLIELATGALDKAEVRADGSTVIAKLDAEIGPAVAKSMAALPDFVGAESDRLKTINNLRQIGLACHNFHDAMGYFPTDIVDPTGKPLLSWRVAILPYIEQDKVYKQLDLTKPWDDPSNAKVLSTMPATFRAYGRDPKEKGMTYLQMPTAAQPIAGGNPFQVRGQRMRIADIQDGTSNTFMVVEATDPVFWAKPDDMRYDPTKRPKVGDPDQKVFQALFGDGSVRAFRRDKLTDEQLKALITVNGGEVVKIPD